MPGLIVGQPVTSQAGSFELYYLFPLTAEQKTLELVQRTVLIAGLALILLVAVDGQPGHPTGGPAGPRRRHRPPSKLAAGDLAQRISGARPVTTWRCSASPSTTWPPACNSRSNGWRSCPELQQRFTSDVSHELRTPLTTVRMAAELLYSSRQSFAPELGRSAELLTNELDRFENLLGELLEISRYDAGAAHLETELLDMVGIVERAVVASQPLAARHGVVLRALLAPAPIPAEVDARRIERVLRNLIANALDHAESKPVEVTVGSDESTVAVTVRDFGIGLRPGEAALVFNRFWRADPSRSRLTGGTGLGLAISLEDARLHDGWLQAWGERGRGSVFRLTLPRTAGDVVQSSPLPLGPVEASR